MRTFKNHTTQLGNDVRQSAKVRRYFDLAKNVAHNSQYGKIRHGALLTKGGSVLDSVILLVGTRRFMLSWVVF